MIKNKMKILSIIENYPPNIQGGAELTQHSYHKYISRNYYIQFRVLTGFNKNRCPVVEGINVDRKLKGVRGEKNHIVSHIFSTLNNLVFLIVSLIQYKPDIIEFVPNNYDLIPLLFITTLLKYPLIIFLHNHLFYNENKSIFNWTDKLISKIIVRINTRSNVRVITISRFMSDELISRGVSNNKIDVILNPIEKTYIPYLANNKVIFASRLEPEKGVEYILKSFKELPNISLEIYGDGSLRSLVIKYTKQYDNIHYHGKVSENEVITAMRSCYCIIAHPIYDEPFGRYIIHSFSTLKPLICSYSGAVPELIFDMKNGLLVKKGDTEGIIRALKLIFTDHKLYLNIINNLRLYRRNLSISKASDNRFLSYVKVSSI